MKFPNKLKNAFFIATALGLVFSAGFAIAQVDTKELASNHTSTYVISDNEPVELYGQKISPHLEKYYREDYTTYRWNDLNHLIPELLPDAKKVNLSPNQLCDQLNTLSQEYGAILEVSEGNLAYELIDGLNNESGSEPFLVDQIIKRMQSADNKYLEELVKMSPDNIDKIMMVKDLTMKYLALVYVHDASIDNCKAHALEKGYYAYTAPYVGDDAPKN